MPDIVDVGGGLGQAPPSPLRSAVHPRSQSCDMLIDVTRICRDEGAASVVDRARAAVEEHR